MRIKTSNHSGTSGHQTVTEFIKLKTPEETIQIGFTDQKVSGRAGLLTFAGLSRGRFEIIFKDPLRLRSERDSRQHEGEQEE